MTKPTATQAEALLAAARRFTRASLTGSQAISSSELGQAEWHLLWLLKHWPDARGAQPSALAERQRVTPGNVAQQLRRLETQGLVVRTQDQQDRRVVLVKLTANGKKKLKLVQKEFVEKFAQLSNQLGVDETAQLIQLLQTAADFLDAKEPAKC